MKKLTLTTFFFIFGTALFFMGCQVEPPATSCNEEECSTLCVDDGFSDGICENNTCRCIEGSGGDGDADGDSDGDSDGDFDSDTDSPDADEEQATQPTVPSMTHQSAGGGFAASSNFRAQIRIGAPQPMGRASSANYGARLGPPVR